MYFKKSKNRIVHSHERFNDINYKTYKNLNDSTLNGKIIL